MANKQTTLWLCFPYFVVSHVHKQDVEINNRFLLLLFVGLISGDQCEYSSGSLLAGLTLIIIEIYVFGEACMFHFIK